MKYVLFFALFASLLLILSCQRDTNDHAQTGLNQNWSFRQAGDVEWLPAVVPGCVHTDLMLTQQIEDPFYRLNEHNLQWIDKEDWEYRNIFVVDQDFIDKEIIEIHFEGLDTYTDVYLNNHLILQANNMFREWDVDIKKHIIKGENELNILFKSPILKGIDKLESLKYTIPVSGKKVAAVVEVSSLNSAVFSTKPKPSTLSGIVIN